VEIIRQDVILNHFDIETCIDFWRGNPLKFGLHDHSHSHLQGMIHTKSLC